MEIYVHKQSRGGGKSGPTCTKMHRTSRAGKITGPTCVELVITQAERGWGKIWSYLCGISRHTSRAGKNRLRARVVMSH